MTYKSESEMYPDVVAWLREFLAGRFRRAAIEVRDTHRFSLNKYIEQHGLHTFFPSTVWQAFDIKVDITAFVAHASVTGVVFVECKLNPISIRDVAQLLGYSRIAQPLQSYLLSPLGIGGSVYGLVLTYRRADVLEYVWERGKQPRSLHIARFDPLSHQLDLSSILPPGSL